MTQRISEPGVPLNRDAIHVFIRELGYEPNDTAAVYLEPWGVTVEHYWKDEDGSRFIRDDGRVGITRYFHPFKEASDAAYH